jgi:hypothetical protein
MGKSADQVVVVFTTDDVYEAELLRNELHNVGIACEVDGESQGGFTEIVPVRLLVRAWDVDRARRVIQRHTGDRYPPPHDEE